jgi:hypothetical protein
LGGLLASLRAFISSFNVVVDYGFLVGSHLEVLALYLEKNFSIIFFDSLKLGIVDCSFFFSVVC